MLAAFPDRHQVCVRHMLVGRALERAVRLHLKAKQFRVFINTLQLSGRLFSSEKIYQGNPF